MNSTPKESDIADTVKNPSMHLHLQDLGLTAAHTYTRHLTPINYSAILKRDISGIYVVAEDDQHSSDDKLMQSTIENLGNQTDYFRKRRKHVKYSNS